MDKLRWRSTLNWHTRSAATQTTSCTVLESSATSGQSRVLLVFGDPAQSSCCTMGTTGDRRLLGAPRFDEMYVLIYLTLQSDARMQIHIKMTCRASANLARWPVNRHRRSEIRERHSTIRRLFVPKSQNANTKPGLQSTHSRRSAHLIAAPPPSIAANLPFLSSSNFSVLIQVSSSNSFLPSLAQSNLATPNLSTRSS